MSEDDESTKPKNLPCKVPRGTAAATPTAGTAAATDDLGESAAPAPDEDAEEFVEVHRLDEPANLTVYERNWCLQSTVDCLIKCFCSVKSLIMRNEDDANFRFKEGKAYILTECSEHEPNTLWFLHDRDMNTNRASGRSLSLSELENSLRGQIALTPGPGNGEQGEPSEIPADQGAATENHVPEEPMLEEEQMLEINLQNEGVMLIDDGDSESVVSMYEEAKRIIRDIEVEPYVISTKKKASILNNVPKMESIPECGGFSSFPTTVLNADETHDHPLQNDNEVATASHGRRVVVKEPIHKDTSVHVRFDDEGWVETMTIESEDTILQLLDTMHEPTANLWLATTGDVAGLERALRLGRNMKEVDHLSRNALHLAVLSGSARSVRLLLEAGFDPNSTDGMDNTPLFYALLKKPSVTIATLLFEYGARIPPRRTPTNIGLFLEFVMMCRPTAREEDLIRLLLQEGASLQDPGAPGGRQALHYAALSNNDYLIRTLVALGADLNACDHRGMTPMDVAVFYACKEAQFCLEDIGIASILNDGLRPASYQSQLM